VDRHRQGFSRHFWRGGAADTQEHDLVSEEDDVPWSDLDTVNHASLVGERTPAEIFNQKAPARSTGESELDTGNPGRGKGPRRNERTRALLVEPELAIPDAHLAPPEGPGSGVVWGHE
jgi:hypothetical protein